MATIGCDKLCGLAAALSVLLAPGTALAQRYTITDLGPTSQANGTGRHGAIVGVAGPHATVWQHGRAHDLGTLGGHTSDGQDIDATGRVVGYSTLADGSYRAFLYAGGSMADLGTLGSNYSAAYALNDAGQIVGSSDTADGHNHAFLYEGGMMTDLGTLGGDEPGWSTTAYGINATGVVAGYSYLPSGDFHAFVYTAGQMQDLGTLGGDWSQAFAINDAGTITGQAYLPGNGDAHAFVWRHGRMKDLGVLNHYSSGIAIGGDGTVVGDADIANDSGYLVYHAAIFRHGAPVDLNTRIPRGTGWTLTAATGLDAAGRIVGYGQLHGVEHGFLLTPR
jgi:probable HAF family extracellular repeat protein